jgi:hypothetical protein
MKICRVFVPARHGPPKKSHSSQAGGQSQTNDIPDNNPSESNNNIYANFGVISKSTQAGNKLSKTAYFSTA